MSSKLHNTVIHSIQVGGLGSSITFKIGQTLGNHIVTRIERNENYLHISGKVVYEVYGERDNTEDLLKYFEDLPVYVSCKLEN